MPFLFARAAVAAIMFAVLPAVAFADDYGSVPGNGDDTGIAQNNPDPTLDLGIDVSGVPHTAAAVKSFIGKLEPQTQSAVMGACETYMRDPSSASSPDTLGFCASAVRG
jgi:hypothetical protein